MTNSETKCKCTYNETGCGDCEWTKLISENTKLKAEIERLKAELEQSVRLPLTNADKIRSMSDEELAEFLSENTNCDCCNIQCVDKLNCPSMSSCLFRFIEWLQSEVLE